MRQLDGEAALEWQLARGAPCLRHSDYHCLELDP
jgi:hypothetical protein